MAKQFESRGAVPVLETERLILCAHALEDFDAFAAMMTDPEVARYTFGQPMSAEEAWPKFVRSPGLWEFFGYGFWTVKDKASGEYLGMVGYGEFMRDIEPSIRGIPEIGWLLTSKIHGQGYGSEAVGAVVRWGDENLKTDVTCCIVEEANVPSIRLAEKFGYREYARAKYHDKNVIMYKRKRP